MGSGELFCFISICKFANFKNPFTTITTLLACLDFTLDLEDWSICYKQKKLFLWTMAAVQAARWVRFDQILLMRDIYINYNLNPLLKFTSSSRSNDFRNILPWNISQMIMKIVPISARIVIGYATKWGTPLWIWWKGNGNWDNNSALNKTFAWTSQLIITAPIQWSRYFL